MTGAMSIVQIIAKHISHSQDRAERVSAVELATFPSEDLEAILECLKPEPARGNRNPCGPPIRRLRYRERCIIHIVLYMFLIMGTVALIPLQLCVSARYIFKQHVRHLYRDILKPNQLLYSWSCSWNYEAYVKAPLYQIRESVQNQTALCVNRDGQFKLLHSGYAVVSHVWSETMFWETPASYRLIDLEVRKSGMRLLHLRKFFDCCKTPVEWLWLDMLAIPEILEDMSEQEKAEMEVLRTACMNNLRRIYINADCAVVLDTTLLRLQTESLLDVAVVLPLSRWMSRLWSFTEGFLVQTVKIQTANKAFDLDEIIDFLDGIISNDRHRYYRIFRRLMQSRPTSVTLVPFHLDNGERTDNPPALAEIYLGCECRENYVNVDHARAVYPILDLQWTPGWTLEEGISYIHSSYPNDTAWLERYLRYRNLNQLLPHLQSSHNE